MRPTYLSGELQLDLGSFSPLLEPHVCQAKVGARPISIRLQVLTRHNTVRPSGRPLTITWPFSNALSSSLSLMSRGTVLHTLARHRSSDAQENELLPVSAVFRYGWVGVSKHQQTERRRDDRGVFPLAKHYLLTGFSSFCYGGTISLRDEGLTWSFYIRPPTNYFDGILQETRH